MRVLVTEELSPQGLELLRKDLQVDVRTDLAKGDLVAEIAPYDALIIRSATQVTAEVLDAAANLRVVARAGIGLDNVDVDAATRRGVMVVNAPTSNIISAAEHTVALLLAQARSIPQAHAALTQGRWERTAWEGVELAGKTIGLVGLGRVGSLVAARSLGLGHARDRVRSVRERRASQGDGRRDDAHARSAAGPVGLRVDPPAADPRDRGPDRRPRSSG